jgi:hypothetical protein
VQASRVKHPVADLVGHREAPIFGFVFLRNHNLPALAVYQPRDLRAASFGRNGFRLLQ